MSHIITNWENDMIDTPEELVSKFVKEKYKDYEFKMLSGLRHRSIEDIYASLNESRVIIMQPSLLEKEQIIKIVSDISHPIHVNNNGAKRDWDIRDFIFLSANPFQDLTTIKEACNGVKDNVNENALKKVLINCEVHFYGFNGEHYEMTTSRSYYSDITAIRYK